MPERRTTGFGVSAPLGGFSYQWETIEGDADIARRVILFLEDRRLLFQPYLSEHPPYCVESAIEIRRFLTDQLSKTKHGRSLEWSLRDIRTAMRAFVDAAGQGANDIGPFGGRPCFDSFSIALGELRNRVGTEIALIAYHFNIDVSDDLAQILPLPVEGDDLSIVPGFEDQR
jgi:hypothetical protein